MLPIKVQAMYSMPVSRLIDDVPTWGWVAAVITASTQFARESFVQLLALLLVTATFDYYFGVRVAKFQDRYRPKLAHAGAVSKAAGVAIVLLIRLLEAWLSGVAEVETQGAVASAIGVALATVDLQSVANHREALGATPIPGLSPVLKWIRMAAPGGRALDTESESKKPPDAV